jgi:glyoxylase-like metal-dependent hydrolase (beta-lactamase superfamily II)
MRFEPNVAPGVHRVEDAYCNWYLVEDGRRLTVVDAGVPTSWASLLAALAQLGREPVDVAAVVLTHAHFDHIGFAERARATLGVEVWVPEDDVPLTRHPLQYAHERSPLGYVLREPGARPIFAALARSRAFFPKPIAHVRRFRADGEALPLPGALRPVATPGHTLGHCALALDGRDAVIAGDALVTLDPYTGATGPRLVARGDGRRRARAGVAGAARGDRGAGAAARPRPAVAGGSRRGRRGGAACGDCLSGMSSGTIRRLPSGVSCAARSQAGRRLVGGVGCVGRV